MDQDINSVDNNSDASESQSIDIKSININNHVFDDCESLSIEINHISISTIIQKNGFWFSFLDRLYMRVYFIFYKKLLF